MRWQLLALVSARLRGPPSATDIESRLGQLEAAADKPEPRLEQRLRKLEHDANQPGPRLEQRLRKLEQEEATPAPIPRALVRFDNETQEHLDTVKMHLRRMLRHTEDLLKYGGEGDRMGICLKLEHETAQLDKLPHSHEAPHDWAIRQIEAEIAFLCMEWEVDRPWQANTRHPPHYEPENRDKKTLQAHLDVMREVLATYEDALACQPGSIPCGRGGVLQGNAPECTCVCQNGWTGAACDEALCTGVGPNGCIEGDCVKPDHCLCHDPIGVGGPACDVYHSLTWATGDWGLCPGKGRHASEQREVGCVRSDGRDLPDSECEARLGEAPHRIQDCCVPFEAAELPYQQCGDVDDGCGGLVSFGSCELLLGHNVNMSSPFYPVISLLRGLLADAQAALHHGSEERAAACASLHQMYRQTDTTEHFNGTATGSADEWALSQVVKELDWLCGKHAEPFEKGEVALHLEGMRDVYDTYLLRIACQPGDVSPCVHGNVTGVQGACTCTCVDGWHGAECNEQ
jgi:hypothetical protein